MYFPTNFTAPIIDPIERERIASGRPESRWEIVQRHHSESRKNASLIMQVTDGATQTGRNHDNGTMNRPSPVANIRRALSRVLITTGERIDPKAA